MSEIAAILKEVGIGAVGIVAIVWIAVYLVRKFVDVSCSHLAALVGELKVFMARVRDEHHQHTKEHEAIMKQHEQMIDTLGRINGYKKP